MSQSSEPVLSLRPRDLVASLFADALDGDAAAEDWLRHLAPHDRAADAALEAIVVADIEARYRDDPDGRFLPQLRQDELDGLLAAVAEVVRDINGRGA